MTTLNNTSILDLNEEFLTNVPVTQEEINTLPKDEGFEYGDYCPGCKLNRKLTYVGYDGKRPATLVCKLGHNLSKYKSVRNKRSLK